MKSLYSSVAMLCAVPFMMVTIIMVINAMFILLVTVGTPICWLTGRPVDIGIVDGLSQLAQYSILLVVEIALGFAFAGLGNLVEWLDTEINRLARMERNELYGRGRMGH